MGVSCDIKEVKTSLRRYAVIANKSINTAVKEEAKMIAERLTRATPPKTLKKGKDIVERDISKVYLLSKWFTEIFSFKSSKLAELVKKAVRAANTAELNHIFEHSTKLKRIHIEAFTPSTLQRFRKNGRVPKKVAPFSYPLQQQSTVKDFIKAKQKYVGLMKSAWARCLLLLGGNVPAWLNKNSNGRVIINDAENSVTLINNVRYAGSLDAKGGYSSFVLGNRENALKTKIDMELTNIRLGK